MDWGSDGARYDRLGRDASKVLEGFEAGREKDDENPANP
jgi:hypothetical protein